MYFRFWNPPPPAEATGSGFTFSRPKNKDVVTSRDVEGRRARDAREAAAFEAKVREVERVLTPGKGPEEATETSDPGDVMHAADRGEASPAPAATKESEFQKSVSRLKRLSLANRMASRE